MIQQKLLSIPIALMLTLSIILVGCDGSGTGTSGETGTLEVQMHDAPANYDEVNVFVESVEVNNADTDTGWVEISSPQQSYDLLELVNGATTVLGSAELPAGTYEQIRLILSRENNSVVVDGKKHSMFVPGGTETGIKLNVNADIEPDITYTLLLDFEAGRSVVERGNEQSGGIEYLLKPVVSATNEAVTGNIAGTVEPADAEPFVYAIDDINATDPDTLSSTKANADDGSFKLIGLEEGTYDVSVNPTNTNYQPKDITGVDVAVGGTAELEIIELSQN
ncbi:DUF4382 domain-containing protein [Fodinibius sp. AD559]|uniref:DUF4382 domain-containing protein n=1 Tax=Fodinibius sp. AD559 TaxID=3424179 RepID=UPI0040469670